MSAGTRASADFCKLRASCFSPSPDTRASLRGEEARDSARTIPRAIPLALGIALGVYGTVAVAVLLVPGPQRLADSAAPHWSTPSTPQVHHGLRHWSAPVPPWPRWATCWRRRTGGNFADHEPPARQVSPEVPQPLPSIDIGAASCWISRRKPCGGRGVAVGNRGREREADEEAGTGRLRNAVRMLRDTFGIDIAGQRPQHFDTVTGRRFDYVISLCDRAREVIPDFPGHPRRVHWSVADPALPATPTRLVIPPSSTSQPTSTPASGTCCQSFTPIVHERSSQP